jgi:hypothetical protein
VIEHARRLEAGEGEDGPDDDKDWETVEESDDEVSGEDAGRGPGSDDEGC